MSKKNFLLIFIAACAFFLFTFNSCKEKQTTTLPVSAKFYTAADSVEMLEILQQASDTLDSDQDAALKISNDMLAKARKLQFHYGIIRALNISGLATKRSGDVEKSIGLFKEAVNIAKENKLKKREASSLGNLANAYQEIGKYSESFNMYMKSKDISEELKDTLDIARGYNNISIVLSRMKNYESAIKCIQKAYDLYTSKRIITGQIETLNNFCLNYMALNKYKEAYDAGLKSTKLCDSIKNNFLASKAYLNLGACYTNQGKHDSALYCYQHTLEISRMTKNRLFEINALNNLAASYEANKKNIPQAIDYYKKALELAEENGYLYLIQSINENIADLYANEKDFEHAYKHHLGAAKANDSLFSQEKIEALSEMQAKFEVKEAENNNKVLQKENDLQKLRLQRKDEFIAGIIITVILLFLFTILWIRQSKIKAQQLNIELEQKQLRARMNPHFIFNCLNSIQHFVVHNDTLNANKYLSEFASLMRKTFDITAGQHISLQDEIEYLDHYLSLEQMRFENKFSYEINVEPGLATTNFKIPPMIVQPFVENAVQHGLRYLENEKGILKISWRKQDKYIVCTLDDNGIGRKQSAQLKNTVSHETDHSTSLTQQRLELISKATRKEVYLDIHDKTGDSGKPGGTLVTIKFPIVI